MIVSINMVYADSEAVFRDNLSRINNIQKKVLTLHSASFAQALLIWLQRDKLDINNNNN